MDSRAFLAAKACLALGHRSSQSKHGCSELVGAEGPAGISPQPFLTPLHCILCALNGFQFFWHPAFPAYISTVCFQRGRVAINVCGAAGKSSPCFHTMNSSDHLRAIKEWSHLRKKEFYVLKMFTCAGLTLAVLQKASNTPTFLALSCRFTEPSMVKEIPWCCTVSLLVMTTTPERIS